MNVPKPINYWTLAAIKANYDVRNTNKRQSVESLVSHGVDREEAKRIVKMW